MHTAIPAIAGVPIEFVLFAAVLAGVALFHQHSLRVALIGLAVITLYKIAFSSFHGEAGVGGLVAHLAKGVGAGHQPAAPDHRLRAARPPLRGKPGAAPAAEPAPRRLEGRLRHARRRLRPVELPRQHRGGDDRRNDGDGALPRPRPRRLPRCHRRRIERRRLGQRRRRHDDDDDVDRRRQADRRSSRRTSRQSRRCSSSASSPRASSTPSSRSSRTRQPASRSTRDGLGVVAAVLAAAIAANVLGQFKEGAWLNQLPAIGLAVWATLLLFAPSVRPDWSVLPSATRGGIFLVSLVLSASMMPIEALPAASWRVALGLGFVSAVFDNIPLTALALRQGGYDWGFLAYAVGFGGSMIWFGSSAGVAWRASSRRRARSRPGSLPAGTSRSATCSATSCCCSSSAGTPIRRDRRRARRGREGAASSLL